MNFDQMWHILEGFHKSSSEHWKSSPCYSDMMREICKFAVSAMKKSEVMQRRGAVSNMMRIADVYVACYFLADSIIQSNSTTAASNVLRMLRMFLGFFSFL